MVSDDLRMSIEPDTYEYVNVATKKFISHLAWAIPQEFRDSSILERVSRDPQYSCGFTGWYPNDELGLYVGRFLLAVASEDVLGTWNYYASTCVLPVGEFRFKDFRNVLVDGIRGVCLAALEAEDRNYVVYINGEGEW